VPPESQGDVSVQIRELQQWAKHFEERYELKAQEVDLLKTELQTVRDFLVHRVLQIYQPTNQDKSIVGAIFDQSRDLHLSAEHQAQIHSKLQDILGVYTDAHQHQEGLYDGMANAYLHLHSPKTSIAPGDILFDHSLNKENVRRCY